MGMDLLEVGHRTNYSPILTGEIIVLYHSLRRSKTSRWNQWRVLGDIEFVEILGCVFSDFEVCVCVCVR